jgi:DNA-binding NarL/FixJ family response regulator
MSTVLLLHGDATVGASLSATVSAAPGLRMLCTVTGVMQAREAIARETPDVLIADLLQPGGNLGALLLCLRGSPDGGPQVLVLSASVDDPRLILALRYGADGYFVPGRPALLIHAIEQVLRGESMMTPQIARDLLAHFDAATTPLRLNEADRSLLQWTAEGYLASEVARGLRLSAQAVGQRMRAIYRKLQFDVRAQRLRVLAA